MAARLPHRARAGRPGRGPRPGPRAELLGVAHRWAPARPRLVPLGVAADAEVRDRDAAGRDQPERAAEPELPVLRASSVSPVRIGEHDQDPADQTTHMATPRDAWNRE